MTDRESDAGGAGPVTVEERLSCELAALRAELADCLCERRRARTLAENSPDIVTRFDRQLRHLYVNPAVEAATGLKCSEFIGRTNAELGMPAEQVRMWERWLEEVFVTGTTRTVEFPFTAPTGAERIYEWCLVPERGEDGIVETVLTIARDVTERKRMKIALRQTGAELRERVKEIHCLYRVAELTRRSDLALPTLFALVLEQLTAAYRWPELACARVRFDGSEVRTERFMESQWRQAAELADDGTRSGVVEIFYRELPGNATAEPFLAEEQSLIDAVAAQLGRTIKERAIQAGKEASEQRYRNLFRNMPDAYALHEIILDEQGAPCDYRYIEVNPSFERMLGVTEAEVVGRRVLELLPATEGYWIDSFGRVALTGEPVHMESYSAEFDRHFEVSAFSPQRGLFAAIFSDVTERHHMRDSLERSTALLERVFESVHVMLAYMDREFNFLLVNRAYAQADGRAPEEYPGRNHFDLYPNAENEALFRRVVESGKPHTVYGKPFRYAEHPEKPVSYWDWRLEPVKTKGGAVEGVVLSLLDVTERIRVEEAAQRVGRFNQLLLDSVGEGIYGLDLEGNCTFVNPAAARMLHYRPEELNGRSAHRLFHHSHPDGSEYPESSCPVHGAFRGGRASSGANEVYWRQDGSQFPIEYISTPLVEKGQVVGAVTSFLDITERKAAEEALRRSEQRLAQAQRIARIGSWELDINTHALSWSDEVYRIFEMDPERFGASYEAFLETIHPEDRAAVNTAYTRSVEMRVPYSIDHRLLFPDGRIKYVHEQCETYYDDGHPVRSLGTVQEITERKHGEEKLKDAYDRLRETLDELRRTQQQVIQSEKLSALGTLAAGVAHELNNPLMGVMGYVAQARYASSDPAVEQVLKGAERELERMRVLLKNMLGFARPIEERLSLASVPEVIERSLALMRAEFKARGIEVIAEIAEGLPPVRVKEGHLQQVFVNLLMNARDVLVDRPRRTVNLSIGRRGGDLVVEMTDSGPGVPAEIRERIFDPFFTTKPPGQGTGLGLSISRNIMADLGGSVRCEGRPGEGATFVVSLPVADGDGEHT